MFGFIDCDKPAGMTSRDVVNVLQRRVRPVKVGHAGTLDPAAVGVLVLGVGPAVRLVPYVQQLPKHYFATFRLAAWSRSGDLEQEVTEYPDLPLPSRQRLEQSATELVGEIEQTPPAHSAIWIDGRRAYDRVRAGEEVDMPTRRVRVDSLSILRYEFPEIELDIVCGSGTYIRSLGIDLASKAGSTAVMTYLCRRGVGKFLLEDAVSIEQLREAPLESMIRPAIEGAAHLPRLVVDATQSARLGHGLCIQGVTTPPVELTEGVQAAAVSESGGLRAIVRGKRGEWCPYRVFPLEEHD